MGVDNDYNFSLKIWKIRYQHLVVYCPSGL